MTHDTTPHPRPEDNPERSRIERYTTRRHDGSSLTFLMTTSRRNGHNVHAYHRSRPSGCVCTDFAGDNPHCDIHRPNEEPDLPAKTNLDRLAELIASVIRDICLDTVTEETTARAFAVSLFVDLDPIIMLAGANPDNLSEARELALEELRRLS